MAKFVVAAAAAASICIKMHCENIYLHNAAPSTIRLSTRPSYASWAIGFGILDWVKALAVALFPRRGTLSKFVSRFSFFFFVFGFKFLTKK